ncbi:MAG: thiamine pyrophosphate-binding protein [Opitutales bacterium]|jgi:sulfopyruvate decarboxylase TPP-binding subunit|nr:thiamine pyrophosphate-binding protein [Opitutales bacterium]
MLSASKIIDALKDQGVTHVVGLADNLCRVLFLELQEEASMEVVHVSREGEAYAIASGLYLGGKKPVVLIQNTGLLESGDAYRGTSWRMEIPQVMLIAYRGFNSLDPEVDRKDSVAEFTEPTLKAWNIPYKVMLGDDDIPMIERAFKIAENTSKPAAVLIAETTS